VLEQLGYKVIWTGLSEEDARVKKVGNENEKTKVKLVSFRLNKLLNWIKTSFQILHALFYRPEKFHELVYILRKSVLTESPSAFASPAERGVLWIISPLINFSATSSSLLSPAGPGWILPSRSSFATFLVSLRLS